MGESVEVDPMGQTSVPGVYAAGNVTDISAQVMGAAAAGTRAGAAVNADLVMTDAREQVVGMSDHTRHEHAHHHGPTTEPPIEPVDRRVLGRALRREPGAVERPRQRRRRWRRPPT